MLHTDRHHKFNIAATVQDNKEISNVMDSVYKKKEFVYQFNQ
jgi:hypothetical protein